MSLDLAQLTPAERKKLRMAQWRADNRERLRAYNRDWLSANKDANAEKAAVRNARYYERSKEEILARKRDRYEAGDSEQRRRLAGYVLKGRQVQTPEERRAKRREADRRYREQNPAAAAARLAARRARLLRATPAWADRGCIKGIYEMAEYLGRLTGVPMNVDHIVPLRSKTVCGLHVQNNLRVMTAEANQKKGARHEP